MKISFDITAIRSSTYAVIFTFISLIFVIIAFSTPYWLAADNNVQTKRFRNLGLWEVCFNTFQDDYRRYDLEYRGCKWIFHENYQFLAYFLRPRKMRHMSDARVSLIIVITLGSITTFLAFVTPYWLASDRRIYGAEFDKLGLWETCFRSIKDPNDLDLFKYYTGCRWVFSNEYKNGQSNLRNFLLPAFFVATQTLYTIGFVLLLIAVIGVLAIQLCFVLDNEIIAMKILSFIMFNAALLSSIACTIFGIKGDDRDWMPDPEHNYLSWSFGLAVAGSFFEWVASILFWVESRIIYKKKFKKRSTSFDLEPTSYKA